MPEGNVEWVMFLYFALGSLGGIAFLVVLVRDLISTISVARKRGRL
jgi:hypothetical protein